MFIFHQQPESALYHCHSPSDEPVRKMRRTQQQSDEDHLHLLDIELTKVAAEDMSLNIESTFDHFVAKVVDIGLLKWRQHNDSSDTFVMNDYSADGNILTSKFVHTTCQKISGSACYSCTCSAMLSCRLSCIATQHQLKMNSK